MTARCLFGAPDPAQNEKLQAKVYNARKLSFERRWNFSIDTESQIAPASGATNQYQYQWEGPFDEEYMAKCDLHRFEISRVPVPSSHSVALLSAPIILDDLIDVEESDFSELPRLDNGIAPSSPTSHGKSRSVSPRSSGSMYNITARNVVTTPKTNFTRIRKHSSSESLSCVTDVMSSPDDLVFTFPNLKQRCITDYMKIKKIPRVKKIR